MKICSKCRTLMPLSNFSKNKTKKDGYSYHCKECMKKYYKEHYTQNKLQYKLRKNRNTQIRVDKFKEFKSTLECIECGENHIATLDFHHINPDTKEYSVAHLARNVNLDLVKKEIDKCVVLCANCHRKHHYNN